MAVILLHLSDIHFKGTTDSILPRACPIAATTFKHLPGAQALFIVVSGDVAFSGKVAEYAIAETFLEVIRREISREASIPIHFILVPGNHDCDFSGDQLARQRLIEGILNNPGDANNEGIVTQCAAVENAFFAFREKLENTAARSRSDRLWTGYEVNVDGKKITFECLNVSWMSQKYDDPGHLVFPFGRYESLKSRSTDVRIVVFHHPLNWYSQIIYRPFREFVRSLAHIVVTGHEHKANIGENLDTESEHSAYIEGGMLQSHDNTHESTFNVVVLDLEDNQYLCEQYSWNGTRYEPGEDEGWTDYRKLPKKRRSEFDIAQSFVDQMEDAGAIFLHPAKQTITLSDVYVFPDLKRNVNDEKAKKIVSSSILLDPSHLMDGVLITGEEKAGRTALLFRMFQKLHEQGLVPLYINGNDIRNHSKQYIAKRISDLVEIQYGRNKTNAFLQLPSSEKIALIDDFDLLGKSERARLEIHEYIDKLFGYVVLTVSELFEMQDLMSSVGSRQLPLEVVGRRLDTYHQYELLPFGFKLRGDLIRKWITLGDSGTRTSAEVFAQYDQAEKIVDTVIGRNVVPSVPLYLLTLLQSIETGRQSDLQNSAMGYYYQYLLTQALERIRIRREEMEEFFHYCTQLTWCFLGHDSKALEESDLRQFNAEYSREYYAVDFERRLEQLCAAKVLQRKGGAISFRYPYSYYYFLGRYLSEHLQDVKVRELVGHYCKHLYVRDYANTVLFLAHHAKDSFVFDTITGVLSGLFSDRDPIEFGKKDGALVSRLIESAPKLTYRSDSSVEDNRRRLQEFRDELLEEGDGLSESEEAKEEISLPAKLMVLFKTVEILGQILRNHYSTIRNPEKVRLLREIFSGPLRALRDFLEFIDKNKDVLEKQVASEISKHDTQLSEEKRNAVAKRTVTWVIQLVCFGFVYKTGSAVASPYLTDNVRALVKSNPTKAFRLIELATKLDFPGAIPKNDIERLAGDTDTDVVAYRLLQMEILHHLYMFKTTEQEKQWLCAKVDIQLAQQRAIEHKTKKTRRLR